MTVIAARVPTVAAALSQRPSTESTGHAAVALVFA
jgi:hypothetical protein